VAAGFAILTGMRKALFAASLLASLLVPVFAQAPPAVPALPDTERRTGYSLTSSFCNCAVGFALYGEGNDVDNWIEVYLNGTRVLSTDPTFGWGLTSPTGSLLSIPRPISDAVLAFHAQQTGILYIVGARRPRRTSQFPENRGVTARDFNQALTDIVAQNREGWDRTNDVTGRTIRTTPGNTLNALPSPSACANQVVGFDASGLNPICLPPAGGGGVGGLVVGTTTVTGGVSSNCLTNNAGILGTGGCGGGGSGTPSITRAQIPTTNTGGVQLIYLTGYRTNGDIGAGAPYTCTGQSSTSWLAIQDSVGNWCALMISATSVINTGWFGAYANNGGQTITSGDIAANPAWRGIYTAGMTWDYVAVQEAMYAAWAPTTTPGTTALSIKWNATNAGGQNFSANRAVFVNAGIYDINKTIVTVASHTRIDFGQRGAAQWWWTGSAATTMWQCDACSYMEFFAPFLSVNGPVESFGTAKPMWSIDWTGAYPTSLKVQQITIYDLVLNQYINGQGVAIGPTGGSQGDTVAFINPLFVGYDSDWAVLIGSANALGITFTNGDCQGYQHDCIQVFGGSVHTVGMHSENQQFNSGGASPGGLGNGYAPLETQFTTNGTDVHIYSAVNGSIPSTIVGWRAEDDMVASSAGVASGGTYFGLDDGYSVIDSGALGVDIANWFANLAVQRGTVWQGGVNFLRAFMMVDTGGTYWRNITSGSSRTITDSGASYTINQWQNYAIRLRFQGTIGNSPPAGNYNACEVLSNTATTITYDTNCPVYSSEAQYEIGDYTAAVSPTFDSAANGHTTYNGSISVVGGSACVDVDSVTYANISVNDYMAIADGDALGGGGVGGIPPLFRMMFYGKVLSKSASGCHGGAQSVTLDHANNVNTPTNTQLWAYYGTPISDGAHGGIKWLEVNYSSFVSPDTAMSAYGAVGSRVDLTGSVSNVYSNRGGNDWASKPTGMQVSANAGQQNYVNITHGISLGSQCTPNQSMSSSPFDMTPFMNSCNGMFALVSANVTLNAPVPIGVQEFTIVFSPGTNNVISFGNNFDPNIPPLNLGSSGQLQMITFRSYGGGIGSTWFEVGRSVVPNSTRTTSNFSATNTTTLTNIPGLSVPVIAGIAYQFEARLFVSSGGTLGGTKAAIAMSTGGFTSGVYAGWGMDSGATPVQGYGQTRTAGTAVATQTVYTATNPTVVIQGTIVASANANLTVQFAQNAANATPTVVQDGSTFTVTRMP
jgi:hypothetical protein